MNLLNELSYHAAAFRLSNDRLEIRIFEDWKTKEYSVNAIC